MDWPVATCEHEARVAAGHKLVMLCCHSRILKNPLLLTTQELLSQCTFDIRNYPDVAIRGGFKDRHQVCVSYRVQPGDHHHIFVLPAVNRWGAHSRVPDNTGLEGENFV